MISANTLRILMLAGCVTLSTPPAAAGSVLADHLKGLRQQLENAHPEQAIEGARALLRRGALKATERQALLSLIAEGEYMRAGARHFENVSAARKAIETLLREFPQTAEAPKWRWRLAWMAWKHGDLKRAAIACRSILAKDQADAHQRRALLLLARIHLSQGQTGEARRQLLQYGLLAREGGLAQAKGQAWMALVDFRENRHEAAWLRMREVVRRHPDYVYGDPELESAWVLLLAREDAEAALRAAREFLRRHIDQPQAAPIQLLLADLLAKRKDEAALKEARRIYALLAEDRAETPIGFKAFMRGLMLDARGEQDGGRLRGMMAALLRIANANQLSPVEDEAMLDLGLLAQRLESQADAPPTRSAALEHLARAADSSDGAIAEAAVAHGRAWLVALLDRHLQAGNHLAAVSLWRRWARFRPARHQAQELYLRVARSMRELMLFEAAERILAELQAEGSNSLNGQRVMIERARLWLDRGDPDGVEKVMRWLNEHPLTLFAPELKLIAARMNLRQLRLQQAGQMLRAISPDDLALELRAPYWRARAETAARLGRWHEAASAWARYRRQPGADATIGLGGEARALFEDGRYAQALERLKALPETGRDDEWRWRTGFCELKTGALEAGRKRLADLAGASSQQPQEGHWRLLARLALADASADELIARAREAAR
ncbi:MAG: tetratricopeptide repeat protein [Mariprofundaceae bacterium]